MLNGFGKLLFLQMFRHIDFEKIDRVPHFAGAEHRIDRRQNHSGNGDDGPLLASALGDALVFQRIVSLVLYRSVSNLYQRRLEVNTGSGDAHRLLLSRTSTPQQVGNTTFTTKPPLQKIVRRMQGLNRQAINRC